MTRKQRLQVDQCKTVLSQMENLGCNKECAEVDRTISDRRHFSVVFRIDLKQHIRPIYGPQMMMILFCQPTKGWLKVWSGGNIVPGFKVAKML